MHTVKNILLVFVAAILGISCNHSKNNDCGSAWIGGEVVNPKKKYIIISKGRKIIDTVKLERDNHFQYHIEDLDPGIYFFSHNEYQAIYIEPNDSIMLRVNTVEFDESLAFTGKGSHKNNLLMDLFLLNEEVDDIMPSMYVLEPSVFEQKLDSIKLERNKLVHDFIDKKGASKNFKETVRVAIDYGLYAKKELYISANARKKVYNNSVEIPASFYNFRKNVDLNYEHYRTFYPYYRFLSFYLDNLSYDQYQGKELFDRESFTHNFIKNKIIDSLVHNDSLKNGLLRGNVGRYFLNAKNEEEELRLLKQYKSISTNESDKREIEKIAVASVLLTPGHIIPNLKLLTTDNTIKDLHSVLNKPSVLYFWSDKSIKHYKNIHIRADELRSKYPEYQFIGINVDTHFKKWLKIIQKSEYHPIDEYQFENFDEAEMKLIISSLNKAMILDADGKIWDGNTNIFDLRIEGELLGYINR